MPLTDAIAESITKTMTQDESFANSAMWQALHYEYPGTAGTDGEITNGTGSQARQQVSYTGSAGTDNNDADVVYEVVSGNLVSWISYWTEQEGGTFLGSFPLVGPQLMAMSQSGSQQIIVPDHGLSVGSIIRCYPVPGTNSEVDSSITEDQRYLVTVVVNANKIEISGDDGFTNITCATYTGFSIAVDNSQGFPVDGTLTFPGTTGITYETVS